MNPVEALLFQPSDINQIGMIVEDLDKAVDIYWDLFKIGPWDFHIYTKHTVGCSFYRGRKVDHEFRNATTRENENGISLELIEHGWGPTIYKDFVEAHGYGLHHLGFYSNNTKQSVEKAKALGLEVIQEGEGLGPNNDGHYAYIDTEKLIGLILEFREPPTARWPLEKQVGITK